MRPLINKMKNLKMNYQEILRGSEILAVVLNVMQIQNVIILTIHFFKVITGFK